MRTAGRLLVGLLCLLSLGTGCPGGQDRAPERTVVVFKHGKIAGDPAMLRALLDRFEVAHPGTTVRDETLPASTDEQHQYYVISLEGKSAAFDVLSMDVIWVPEFARAGWLAEVGDLIAGEEQEFFPGPMAAVSENGRTYAVPWYIDAGVLYYRKDLLQKHRRAVPATWHELVETAKAITAKEPGVYGFLWQGKQYEGLVCNTLEFLWSNGGDVLIDGRPALSSPQNVEALRFMRDLITVHGVTPPLVTTVIEEPTRHLFGGGKVLFLRNWPYAWNLFEAEGSAVKGKVGIAPLPAFPGNTSAATLGGWQLGVNRYSRNRKAALELVRFLTSPEIQKTMALTIGYKPTRRSLYRDEELMRQQPFIASLYGILLSARPRPVTPYYMMMTQVMQPEFSAALAGVRSAEEALASAQEQVAHILGVRP